MDRMHLRRELKPFSQRDTFEYVYRAMAYAKLEQLRYGYEFPSDPDLARAGANGLSPFNIESVARIFALTGGVPRHVRLLCSQAISVRAREAEAVEQHERFKILASVVVQAWDSLLGHQEVHQVM